HRGARACSHSGISGWFSLSLGAWVPKKLARRRMVSAGAMLLDRLGPPEFRFIDFRAPRLPYLSPLRARAPGSAGCYGVARQREGSRQNGIGGSGVLSLRHFSGWFSLSLGAWVPKKLARRRMVSAGAMLLDRLRPAEFRFIYFRAPRLPYLSPVRARAPGSAGCYGVARQREGSRQNGIGGSGVLSLRHFSGWFSLSLGAWVPKNLPRRRMVLAGAMRLRRLRG